jgi:hypothetical protein
MYASRARRSDLVDVLPATQEPEHPQCRLRVADLPGLESDPPLQSFRGRAEEYGPTVLWSTGPMVRRSREPKV